jgi:co-chaperonin GroES (HSP10)
MKIRAVHNHIIFQFEDAVTAAGEFEEANHKSGLYIKGGFEKSAKSPRWATVVNTGPDCEHVRVGNKILIPALRWTEGVKFEGQRFWKTDETQLAGYVKKGSFVPLNDNVVFTQNIEKISEHSSGLLVISHIPTDTPTGVVTKVAKGCMTQLRGATIYYDLANFFDTFEYEDVEYAFIKEDKILAYAPTEG